MYENIRLLKFDPRDYWRDLLGLFVVGFIINRIYTSGFIPEGVNYFPFELKWILIAGWIIVYLLIWKPLVRWLVTQGQRIREVFFENRYFFDLSRFEKEWEFQGHVSKYLRERELQITNTPSGCFIKNDFWDSKVWRNFSATLEIDFRNVLALEDSWVEVMSSDTIGRDLRKKVIKFRKIIAVVFRAQNFDDYFMLSFWKVGRNIIFRPHVQVSGNLDIPLLNPVTTNNYILEDDSEVIQFKMLVKENNVRVFIKQGKRWGDSFSWSLPDFYKTNLNQGKKDDGTAEHITRKIPFKRSFGQIGFRNYGEELAFVRSLTVNGKFSMEEEKLLSQ